MSFLNDHGTQKLVDDIKSRIGQASVDTLTENDIQDIKDAIDAAVAAAGIDPATGNPRKLYEVAESLTQAEMEDIKNTIASSARVPFPTAQFKYSTSEIIVGEWIDGRKIFQKTWQFTGDGGGSHIIDLTPTVGDIIVDFKVIHLNQSVGNVQDQTSVAMPYMDFSSTPMTYVEFLDNRTYTSGHTYFITLQWVKAT